MSKTGVLLINTGTPDAPTQEAIARYLSEILSDPALINVPPFIWKRILKYVILPRRPAKTKPVYERLWTPQGSPFMLISQSQRDLVARALGTEFETVLAMRYGNPSIAHGLSVLREAGCERIVAVPLYPQYAKVCAGTCFTEVDRCLAQMSVDGWQPKLVKLKQFFEQSAYLDGIADSIRASWPALSNDTPLDEHAQLVFSWHSTLMADINAKDPYRDQCEKTAEAVAQRLGLDKSNWCIGYASRFDNRKWLQPFTNDLLASFACAGVKDLCIVCPGFLADNIETSIEIAEGLRSSFLAKAVDGAHFTYVSALNDSSALTEALCTAIHEILH